MLECGELLLDCAIVSEFVSHLVAIAVRVWERLATIWSSCLHTSTMRAALLRIIARKSWFQRFNYPLPGFTYGVSARFYSYDFLSCKTSDIYPLYFFILIPKYEVPIVTHNLLPSRFVVFIFYRQLIIFFGVFGKTKIITY